MSVYLIMFPVHVHVETNVVDINDTVHSSPGGLFFLVNYLNISDAVQYHPTYLHLVFHVLSLFSVLYLISLPLVFVGFFRNQFLSGWVLFLLVGSFNPLITPFCALDEWIRWMFMLVYPFSFYAANGIVKVLESRDQRGLYPDMGWLKWMKLSRRTITGILLCIGLLGVLFIGVRYGDGGFLYLPSTISYFPSTMLHNSVPLQDVTGTVQVMKWLNEHMDYGSAVLVHHVFLSWASLYLDKKDVVIHYTKDAQMALDTALQHGFSPVYLVWWNEKTQWYSITVPRNFVPIFGSGRIYVFERLQEN
jgi:hypothetical protein